MQPDEPVVTSQPWRHRQGGDLHGDFCGRAQPTDRSRECVAELLQLFRQQHQGGEGVNH